jgi:hypothetical protein
MRWSFGSKVIVKSLRSKIITRRVLLLHWCGPGGKVIQNYKKLLELQLLSMRDPTTEELVEF